MAENGSADSYIGSLISLTSKSDIRYEGILYTVDTENSNIALQNVRSFGTEGRKKDGPQIPASDKVFEYIIFRGTDIKDLQVKVSPRFSVHDDPAIISLQAQPSQSGSAVRPYGPLPPVAVTGNMSSYASPSTFSTPLSYNRESGSNVALRAPPTPVLSQHGIGAPDPMYWQGLYKMPTVEQRSVEHQLQPQISPPIPKLHPFHTHAPQDQLFTTLSAPLSYSQACPTFSQTSANSATPSNRSGASPESMLLPSSSGSTSFLPLPSMVSSDLETRKASIPATSAPSYTQVSGILSSGHGIHKIEQQAEDLPPRDVEVHVAASTRASQSGLRTESSSNTTRGVQSFWKNTMASKQVSRESNKGVNFSRSGLWTSGTKMQWAPMKSLVHLPISEAQQKPCLQTQSGFYESRRGRGRVGDDMSRGRGMRQRVQFLEDFDFVAMNEKFKKEEVWGELLKVEQDKIGNSSSEQLPDQHNDFGGSFDQSQFEFPRQAVYVKDEFFDSLSCESLNRGDGKVDRSNYLEQRKIDSQTFGRFILRSCGGFRGRQVRGGRRGVGRGRGYSYQGFDHIGRSPGPGS